MEHRMEHDESLMGLGIAELKFMFVPKVPGKIYRPPKKFSESQDCRGTDAKSAGILLLLLFL